MDRNMLLSIFASDDGRSENGIGWSETCGHGQRREEVEFRDKGINEPSRDEPPLSEISELKQTERDYSRTYVMTGARRNNKLFQCWRM